MNSGAETHDIRVTQALEDLHLTPDTALVPLHLLLGYNLQRDVQGHPAACGRMPQGAEVGRLDARRGALARWLRSIGRRRGGAMGRGREGGAGGCAIGGCGIAGGRRICGEDAGCGRGDGLGRGRGGRAVLSDEDLVWRDVPCCAL